MIEKIKKEFIYGGHLLSLGASSIVVVTSLILDYKLNLPLICVAYLGSQIVYIFNRLYELKNDKETNKTRTLHVSSNYKYFKFFLFIFIVLIAIALVEINTLSVSLFVLSLLAIGILYSTNLKSLSRKIIGFKNIIVSISWACLVFLVIIANQGKITHSSVFLFTFILIRWFVNTSFFDVKDTISDKKSGLKTFIIELGEKKFFSLLVFLSFLASVIIIVGIITYDLPLFSASLLLTLPFTFFSITTYKKHVLSNDTLFNVIIDSEFLFWTAVVLLSKIIYGS